MQPSRKKRISRISKRSSSIINCYVLPVRTASGFGSNHIACPLHSHVLSINVDLCLYLLVSPKNQFRRKCPSRPGNDRGRVLSDYNHKFSSRFTPFNTQLMISILEFNGGSKPFIHFLLGALLLGRLSHSEWGIMRSDKAKGIGTQH